MTNIINNIASTISNWQRRRTTIGALSALSDHALKDIGLHRSEIRSLAEDIVSDVESSRIRAVRSTPARQRAAA